MLTTSGFEQLQENIRRLIFWTEAKASRKNRRHTESFLDCAALLDALSHKTVECWVSAQACRVFDRARRLRESSDGTCDLPRR